MRATSARVPYSGGGASRRTRDPIACLDEGDFKVGIGVEVCYFGALRKHKGTLSLDCKTPMCTYLDIWSTPYLSTHFGLKRPLSGTAIQSPPRQMKSPRPSQPGTPTATAVSVRATRVRGVPENLDGMMRVSLQGGRGVGSFPQASRGVDVSARLRLRGSVLISLGL